MKTHLVFEIPFHGEAQCGDETAEIHDGVCEITLKPKGTLKVTSHDYGGFEIELPAKIDSRMNAPVADAFMMQWQAKEGPKPSKTARVRRYVPAIMIGAVIVSLGMLVAFQLPQFAPEMMQGFNTLAFAPSSMLVFISAVVIVAAIQALTQGEQGWLEDLWAAPAMVANAILWQVAKVSVFQNYIMTMTGQSLMDAVRLYGEIKGIIEGFLFAQLLRAITVQRTARRLDLSPLAAFATLMLVSLKQGWLEASTVSYWIYGTMLVISLFYEVIKQTPYPQEWFFHRGVWAPIGLVCAILMIAGGTQMAYLMLAILTASIVGVGYFAKETLDAKYGRSTEYIRNAEVMPWIAMEVALNFWFWFPVLVTSIQARFGG